MRQRSWNVLAFVSFECILYTPCVYVSLSVWGIERADICSQHTLVAGIPAFNPTY